MVQSVDWLTPNQQLLVNFGLFLAVVGFIAVVFVLLYRHQLAFATSLGGDVKPFWAHLRSQASINLRHPHDWALEKDALMDAAELEPETPMPEKDYERLMEILAQMVNHPEQLEGMRDGERDYAAIMLIALPRARKEAKIKAVPTEVRLVGSTNPPPESAEDASAQQASLST